MLIFTRHVPVRTRGGPPPRPGMLPLEELFGERLGITVLRLVTQIAGG